MKQLVFAEPGKLEWQDVPDPIPGPGQAVVRPLAVSRCDLDVAMAAFGIFPGPFPVGHEIAAEVVDVGPGVRRIKPGQRVAVPFQVSCGTCEPCRERHYAACEPNQARAGATAAGSPTCLWCPPPTTCCWPRRSRSAMSRRPPPPTTPRRLSHRRRRPSGKAGR